MSRQADPGPIETLGVAATGLGLLSLALCWWFPFGAVVGGFGAGLGALSRLMGPTRVAMFGMLYSAVGLGAGMLLAWDHWAGVLGL